MNNKTIFLFFSLNLFIAHLYGHGFSANTYVKAGKGFHNIKQVCHHAIQSKISIASYDFNISTCVNNQIKAVGESETNCYFKINFDQYQNDILCTPSQEFYLAHNNEWVPAYLLQPGDLLLNGFNQLKPIVHIELIKEPLTVYALQIDKTHTFMVGRHAIITHNMMLPVLNVGLSFAFGSGVMAGGATGSYFGPIACVGGIALGGIVGIITRLISQDNNLQHYNIHFDICEIERHSDKNNILYNENAQAPGMPTEKDGFSPPKNWNGEKVRHPRGYGWPDNKGRIWIPTGNGGSAHGGPHWDVQYPGKGKNYDNVFPGGMVRKRKK